MSTLFDKVDKKIREGNEGSAEGWVKQAFINIFVSLEDIKKGIPEYAEVLIHEMKKSKTKGQIRAMLNEQLKQYLNQTFDAQEAFQLNRILLMTDSKNIESARSKLIVIISQ